MQMLLLQIIIAKVQRQKAWFYSQDPLLEMRYAQQGRFLSLSLSPKTKGMVLFTRGMMPKFESARVELTQAVSMWLIGVQ
jgi:hypothetical protein